VTTVPDPSSPHEVLGLELFPVLCLIPLYYRLLGSQVVKALDCRPRGPGSGPTGNRDFFLFRVNSALTQNNLRRRVTFVSFGGDIKLLVPGDLV